MLNSFSNFSISGEWPPTLPDLSPLDYSVWSVLEETACAKPHSNVESLKRALKKAWNEISVEALAEIADNLFKRLQKCVDANGGHFEEFIVILMLSCFYYVLNKVFVNI